MTKQQKIQLEYSVYWEQVKDLVDDFGWIKNSKLHPSNISNFNLKVEWKFDEGGFYARDKWRPKSLENLETNNGWIKVIDIHTLPEDLKLFNFIACNNLEKPFVGFIDSSYSEVFFYDFNNYKVKKEGNKYLLETNAWLKTQITHFQSLDKTNNLCPLF